MNCPRRCLSSRDGGNHRAALCGREDFATQVLEFTRKRLNDEIHGGVHGILGLRDAAVDDDFIDDPRRDRDHPAHDRVGRAAGGTRLAWRIVLARKDGDAADEFFLVVQVKLVGRADGVFVEPNEDLEDPEILDRLKVGREANFTSGGHSDMGPGGRVNARRGLLGIDAVILGDSRARLLALFEASRELVDLDTQEFLVGIICRVSVSRV